MGQEVRRAFEVPHRRRKVPELPLHAPEGPQRFPFDLRDRKRGCLPDRFRQDYPRVLVRRESIRDPPELDVRPEAFRRRPRPRDPLEDRPRLGELSQEHLRLRQERVEPRILRHAEQGGLQVSRPRALRERRSTSTSRATAAPRSPDSIRWYASSRRSWRLAQ